MNNLDLTIKGLPLGTHELPWDLTPLVYPGMAGISRKEAARKIKEDDGLKIQAERVSVVKAFHQIILTMVSQGLSRTTLEKNIAILWSFFAWIDDNNKCISKELMIDWYKEWAEHLLFNHRIKKEISANHLYRQVSIMANLIAKSMNFPGTKPGRSLLLQTRVRKPSAKKKVLSTKADKQNLKETFEFGYALRIICENLDVNAVRGRLPIIITIGSEKEIIVAGNLIKPSLVVDEIEAPAVRANAERARAPMRDEDSLFDNHKRSGILNLRVEAELLIFIAQTGMNLAQAINLDRELYRWASDGDDLEVFRVYKGRRSGDAVFRCYKAYRGHFEKYLRWLDETKFSEFDSRLFPLLSRGMIRSKNSKVSLSTIKKAVKQINMPFCGAQKLRKTRVNWLLRRSGDASLTAAQVAHDKEVLLRDYESPHHQSAASEIIRFHSAMDPKFSTPGPGVCVDKSHKPVPISNLPKGAPEPDCVSPEGCLFCSKHRDVMSEEYCWKLASHARIKMLEVTLHKSPVSNSFHPAYLVIDRIQDKLNKIKDGGKVREMWVNDAQNSVRSGRYHPYWEGHIKLLEIIS